MFDITLQPIYIPLMVTDKQHYWDKFGFFGGQVFLDFINTFDDLDKSRCHDALPDWQTVLLWSEKAALLNTKEKKILSTSFSQKVIHDELSILHTLRDIGWKILHAIAVKAHPDPAVLNKLSKHLELSYAHSSLVYDDKSFHWAMVPTSIDANLIRIRLGLLAGELLTSNDSIRISECCGCTGLFINEGRGIGRKWCRMSTCGNRAKIKKFRSGKNI